jgi:hypothetical protein
MFSKRGTQVRMMATEGGGDGGDGPRGGKEFFDFPATRITGEEIKKLGDIVGDKKAILVVNVASE